MITGNKLAHDSASVLRSCRAGSVSVNGTMGAAIDAHQIAYSRFLAIGDTESHRVAACALRAVVLAMTPKAADCRQQLEYLAALPLGAWEHSLIIASPAETRSATLAAISWVIARRSDN